MSKDLAAILSDWPYDPDEVRARWIVAGSGRR